MTLSTPVKIVALAGLALVLGMGGLLLVTHKGSAAPVLVPTVSHQATLVVAPAKHARPAKPKRLPISLAGNLPPALRRGLLKHPEVVAVVYSSNISTDRAALVAAREAAHAAHAGFVALNVLDNATAAAVAGWTTTTATPTVFVVRRPGASPAYALGGPLDREIVAEAVRAAK